MQTRRLKNTSNQIFNSMGREPPPPPILIIYVLWQSEWKERINFFKLILLSNFIILFGEKL
jgi:hypothetical protein